MVDLKGALDHGILWEDQAVEVTKVEGFENGLILVLGEEENNTIVNEHESFHCLQALVFEHGAFG